MMLKMLIANWLQEQAKEQLEAVRQSLDPTAQAAQQAPLEPCNLVLLFASAVEA